MEEYCFKAETQK